MKHVNVVWFRRDLRLQDNAAVATAAASGKPTLFVFTLDPWFFAQAEISPLRCKFLFESLQILDVNLRMRGNQLFILEGKSAQTIQDLLKTLRKQGLQPALHHNRDVQVSYGLERDEQIGIFCAQNNLPLHKSISFFLQEIEQHPNDWKKDYHAYQKLPQWQVPANLPSPPPGLRIDIPQIQPDQLDAWAASIGVLVRKSALFQGGENNAHEKMHSFLNHRRDGYHWKLSRPYLAQQGATSHLSAHLAFGTISARSVYQASKKQIANSTNPKTTFALRSFLDRLRWKDSFTQRLYFRPELMWQNRHKEFDKYYTDTPLKGQKAELFSAWKDGQTGYPLLDASMRQLATDGWINFRMRAQAATMLTIIFGVSWHHGARHFMQQLVDGDIAINHWQWQMQAGITNPLSPTFRIYNPSKNLETKDPQLDYIKHWLPEYQHMFTPKEVLNASQPIVDFATARKQNGKAVSDLRTQVRARVQQQLGIEHDHAVEIDQTVKNYYRRSQKRYDNYQQELLSS